jgi:hypothetical protein
MQTVIPYYRYDGRYLDHITVARARRLEASGRVLVVRHRKGHINRVILLRGTNEPKAARLHDYLGRGVHWRRSSCAQFSFAFCSTFSQHEPTDVKTITQ